MDESGRCTLHPGIQLRHKKKNGEWRILLNACPLCVSGLPPTGQPICTGTQQDGMGEATSTTMEGGGGEEQGSPSDNNEVLIADGGGDAPSEVPPAIQIHNIDGQQSSPRSEKNTERHLSPSSELDRKIQKRKKKSKSKHKDKEGKSGRRSSLASSKSSPGARPRSPSPQSPALRNKVLSVGGDSGKKQEGENGSNNTTPTTVESSFSSPGPGLEYGDFLQYLESGLRERDLSKQRAGQRLLEQQLNQHNNHQQQTTNDIDRRGSSTDRRISEYSAAETVENYDSSHGAEASAEDEKTNLDVKETTTQRVPKAPLIPQEQEKHHHMPQNPNVTPKLSSDNRPALPSPPLARRSSPQAAPPPKTPPKTPLNQQKSSESSIPAFCLLTPKSAKAVISLPTQVDDNASEEKLLSQSQTSPNTRVYYDVQLLSECSEPNLHRSEPALHGIAKRPDPEDTDEFNQMYLGQHHQAQSPRPTSSPLPRRPSPIQSTSPAPRREYQVAQQHQMQEPLVQQEQQQPRPSNSNNNGTQNVLEQDEVSVMSMSSVIRNMVAKKQTQHRGDQQIQEEDDEDDDDDSQSSSSSSSSSSSCSSSSDSDSYSTDQGRSSYNSRGRMINTCDYDDKGRCKRHPTVRLRQKQFMRGWKVVLSNCPECCLDEMRRVKDARLRRKSSRTGSLQSSPSSRGSRSRNTGGSKSRGSRSSKGSSHHRNRRRTKNKKKGSSNKNPPISQLSLRNSPSRDSSGNSNDEYDDSRSVGTASTITISSYTHSSVDRWQNYASDSQQVASNTDAAAANVTRMPYTAAYGERGWYTGQVDSSTGIPHGVGTMNYGNGDIYQGEWRDGLSASPSKTGEEPPATGGNGGGGGTLHSPPRINMHARPSPWQYRQRQQFTASRSPSLCGRSYLATLNEDGSSSDYEYTAPTASSGRSQPVHSPAAPVAQRMVVCGMRWTDSRGDSGTYTGEVNGLNIPDGVGSMRCESFTIRVVLCCFHACSFLLSVSIEPPHTTPQMMMV